MWMCGRTKWILGSTLILTEVFGSSVPNSLVANDSGFNIAGNRSGLMRIWRVHTKLFSAPSGLPMVLHPALPWGILSTDTWCLWILSASTCPKTVYSLPSVPSPCGFGKWKQLCDLGVKIFISKFSSNILDQHNLNSCSFISGHVAKTLVSKRPQRSEIYS